MRSDSVVARGGLVVVALCVVFGAAALPARAQDAALAERVDELFAEYDRPGSPGCAVGVVRGGSLVFSKGYGLANLDHEIPLTPSSVFYLASVSKQFTAAVVALLAADGLIGLDDDVREYVPELPDYGRVITIRQLIHHTSGLRDYLTLMSMAGMRREDVHTDEEVLELLARQRRLNFLPGDEHLYSNSGYFLVSVITRRVTGKSLREYADEKIFRPLGMRNTHFHDDRTMVVKGRVTSYAPAGSGGYRLDYWANFDKVGSGGLLSSVEDLARWAANFYENRLSAPDLLELMHERGVLSNGDTLDYAFGLRIGTYRGLRTVGHGGSSMGFRTHFLRFPDQRFTVIVLCNVGTASPAALAERIADLYLEDEFTTATVASAPRTDAGADRPPASLPVARLEAYAGDYRSEELDVSYTLVVEGDRLVLRRPAAAATRLVPLGDDAFRAGAWTLAFVRGPGDRVTGFTLDAPRARGLEFVRR